MADDTRRPEIREGEIEAGTATATVRSIFGESNHGDPSAHQPDP